MNIQELEQQLKEAKKNQQIISQSFLDTRKEDVRSILQNHYKKHMIESKHSIEGDYVYFEYWHYTGRQNYRDEDITYHVTIIFNTTNKNWSIVYPGSINMELMNKLNNYLINKLS